jgi:hypothetical protein
MESEPVAGSDQASHELEDVLVDEWRRYTSRGPRAGGCAGVSVAAVLAGAGPSQRRGERTGVHRRRPRSAADSPAHGRRRRDGQQTTVRSLGQAAARPADSQTELALRGDDAGSHGVEQRQAGRWLARLLLPDREHLSVVEQPLVGSARPMEPHGMVERRLLEVLRELVGVGNEAGAQQREVAHVRERASVQDGIVR